MSTTLTEARQEVLVTVMDYVGIRMTELDCAYTLKCSFFHAALAAICDKLDMLYIALSLEEGLALTAAVLTEKGISIEDAWNLTFGDTPIDEIFEEYLIAYTEDNKKKMDLV